MATTWQINNVNISGRILEVSVQEVIDSIPDKIYTAKINKNNPDAINQLLGQIRDKARADRAREAASTIVLGGINLTNFEGTI